MRATFSDLRTKAAALSGGACWRTAPTRPRWRGACWLPTSSLPAPRDNYEPRERQALSRPAEAIPEDPGSRVRRVVIQRLFHMLPGSRPVRRGEVREGKVVVSQGRFRPIAEGPLQVGHGLGEPPLLIVQDAAVQGRGPEVGRQRQSTVVIAKRLGVLAPGGVGQRPVVVAFRRR